MPAPVSLCVKWYAPGIVVWGLDCVIDEGVEDFAWRWISRMMEVVDVTVLNLQIAEAESTRLKLKNTRLESVMPLSRLGISSQLHGDFRSRDPWFVGR